MIVMMCRGPEKLFCASAAALLKEVLFLLRACIIKTRGISKSGAGIFSDERSRSRNRAKYGQDKNINKNRERRR